MPESANEHLEALRAILAKKPPRLILDVGMGRGNYGWWLRNELGFRGRLVGLEVWPPYVAGPSPLAGGNLTYYDEVLVVDVRQAGQRIIELRPDVVLAFDVLEHMPRNDGVEVLRQLQRAALERVLVSVPIVPMPQGPVDGNPYEEHQHDWSAAAMMGLGSEMRGRGEKTGLFDFPAGGVDRLVTVMVNTVREDGDNGGRGSPLRAACEDLARQTMPFGDFELVLVDGLQRYRPEVLELHGYPFRVLHVPPKDSPMVRDGRCSICAYKNTGLAHARGQLVITADDACRMPPNYLERVWRVWARDRQCLSALARAVGSVNVNDSRVIYFQGAGRVVGPVAADPKVPPMYGFAALPLEAVLAVNGYDEMFDGSRGLEDVDMGIRLQRAGYRIALERDLVVEMFPQGPWSERIFGASVRPGATEDHTCIKCCQTTLRVQHGMRLTEGPVRANERGWTAEEWGKVAPRCFLLKGTRCGLHGQPCPYVGISADREHPGLAALRERPPVFSLRDERIRAGIR